MYRYYFIASDYEDMKNWMTKMHQASVISKPIPTESSASQPKEPQVDLTPKRDMLGTFLFLGLEIQQ